MKKKEKIKVICKICKKIFFVIPYRKDKAKCCSYKCSSILKSTLSINNMRKNGMWKGENVGYCAIHDFIKYHVKKPTRCHECNKIKRLDLHNKSHKYLRDFYDWEWLCRRCHMVKDGRLEKLITRLKNRKLPQNYCRKCKCKIYPYSKTCRSCANRIRWSEWRANKMLTM